MRDSVRLRHSSSRWLAFAVLFFVSTAAESNADADQRPGRRRSRNRGRPPPQPGDLSLVDDGKQLLAAGVDIKTPQENTDNNGMDNAEDDKQVPTAVRGMLYHYEPILPPYDGRYFDEVEEAAAAAALSPSVPAVEPIEEDETEPVASTNGDALSADANEGSATSVADNAGKSTKEADEDTVAAEEEEGIGTESEELSTLADAIVDAAMTLDDKTIGKVADKLEEDGTQSQQRPMEQAASDENADDNDDADAERAVTDENIVSDDNDADDNDADDNEGKKSVSVDNTTVNTIDVEISAAMEEEEEDIVVEEESSASTAKVESPKADGNSAVVAEKASKVDSEIVGVGSTPVNASYIASEMDGLIQPDKEGTDTTATDAENDDVEANDGGAEEQAAQPTSDLNEQPTENIGIDADSDQPSEMLGDSATNSRRIAEEKGVPTNIGSAASVAGGANTTLGDNEEGDPDAGPSDIAGDDSVEGVDANTVPNNDEQIDASEIRQDSQRHHESWSDRELGNKEGETGAKRLDVESLDNVREYSGSDGVMLTGSTISREAGTATIDNATAAIEAKDDAFEESIYEEKNDEDTAAGSTDESSTNTELPAFDSLSDVNSDFIDGIDDLDKFLEEVDTPDELDVAHGSSMQEVLVGKGVQILVKKATAVVRRVKSIVSIIGTRVGKSKIAGKIREGMETSGIIALGEKVREASSISEHKEKVAGFGKTVGRAVDEKWDAMNAWIDELMDNDFVDTAKNILGRIKASSVVTRIARALGLSEDEDDDDDLMDFSSFKRSGNNANSLEDRLAAMRKQAMY